MPKKSKIPAKAKKKIAAKAAVKTSRTVAKKTPAPKKRAARPAKPEAVVWPAAPEAPPPPSRAPIRKVFGAGNVVTMVLPKGAPIQQKDEPAAEPVPIAAVAESAPPPQPAPIAVAPAPKVPWDRLPRSVSPSVRFTIEAAMRESESAAASPFPFVKFIAALPREMCGLEFAALLLSANAEAAEVGRMCGMDAARAEATIASAGASITDLFSEHCSEMYRNWNAKLGSRGAEPEALIEHHLVAKVDRNFQAMLAGMLLKVMQLKNPITRRTIRAMNGDVQ